MNVFVYTINTDGEVQERTAALSRRKGNHFALAEFGNGHRIIVSSNALTLHNGSMWSEIPRKALYVEKMTELLMERLEGYRDKARKTEYRIRHLKECVR